MRERNKYPLNKSPLFGLTSKAKLYKLLVTDNRLLHIPKNDKKLGAILLEVNNANKLEALLQQSNYRIFEEKQSGRVIQDPKPFLKLVHKKLANLLSRIYTPDYLHSGVKGKSYVSNAEHHLKTPSFLLKLDLRKFYQNCSKEFVFKAFKYTFDMPDDVAWLVANLVTYKDFLPTGSPVSQLIAFFAYQKTFDKIDALSKSRNITFSLYVDDMCFSSSTPIANNMEALIKKEFEKVKLPIHAKKTIYYKSHKQHKNVTGCIISPDKKLKVPNKRRLEIINEFKKLDDGISRLEIRLLGKIQAARQIEPNIFQDEYFHLRSVVSLEQHGYKYPYILTRSIP
ncbi:hypothetical protein JCM14076_03030 [Methylosoma difficile]